MTFKKTSTVGGIEVVGKNNFPNGARYLIGDTVYVVIECFESDNAPMRRVLNQSSGDQEILMLKALQGDLNSGIITWVNH